MPQKTNLNVTPYYDDFSQTKNFYKVLFRPGYSIQARELTQLQSVLQNQIESFGKYAFKQGELVIPGEVGINTKLPYVKLSSVSEIPINVDGKIVYKKYDITQLRGLVLRGNTSGVTATVIDANVATDTASDVLYVNYTNSGDASNEVTFRQGETLEVVDGVNTPLMVVGTDGSVLPTSISITDPDTGASSTLESTAMGFASAVKVEEGIYFVNGYFVRNAEQLLIIDPYYNKPSAKVGFKIIESVVTAEEDNSLYDNAIGSSNFSAPGANRLSITLDLVKYNLDVSTDKNFIQILTVRKGAVQSQIVQTDYNLLEQTLARRTYDESGDYVVEDFSLDVREYYQEDGNLGVYGQDEFGLVNGLSVSDAKDKLIASVSSGKAYVKGFEIVNKETKYLPVSKARETLDREDIRKKTTGLPTYRITNTYGSTPLNADGGDLTAYPNVFLSSVFNDGSVGLNGSEADNDSKQTTSRRGHFFDQNQGIKTVYVQKEPNINLSTLNGASSGVGTFANNGVADSSRTAGTYTNVTTTTAQNGTGATFDIVVAADGTPTITLNQAGTGYASTDTLSIIDGNLGGGGGADITITVSTISGVDATDTFDERLTALSTLYWVQGRNVSGVPNTISPIDVIAYSEVSRPELDDPASTPETYLELTLAGDKNLLDKFFTEYDAENSGDNGIRELFRTKVDGENDQNRFGIIRDYNETITPVIGIAKPSNFTLVEKGTGFNTDTDIILSKGKLSDGTSVYNSIFGLSYFDPQFFTKLLLDDSTETTGGFTPGQYVYGVTSGAYGVVEGSSTGSFSKNKVLMVKTLFGTFKSGEIIRDENNNSVRIAQDNTISHFIVTFQGVGYESTGCSLKIDGVDYDSSKIELDISTSKKVLQANIISREFVNVEYSKPPTVLVNQKAGNAAPSKAAKITPVLVRNAVTTFTPQNVKSFYAEFGSGNSNVFTSDIEINNDQYVESIPVTNFTFGGEKGNKFIECNGFGGDSTRVLQQGDIVQFSDTDENIVRCIVQYPTKPSGVLKSRIYFDRALPQNVSNTSVVRIRPNIKNFNQGTLLYKTGTKQVSSIVATSEDSKITHYVRRDFVSTGSSSGGSITFTAQLPFGTQRFVSFSESNFLVTILEKGSATSIEKGDIIYLTSDQVSISASTDAASGLTSGSVVLSLPQTFFGGDASNYTEFPKLKLSATLEVSKAKPRLKTAKLNTRIVIESPGDRVIPFRGKNYDTQSVETFTYADAFKLRYVYEGTTQDPPTVDAGGNLVSGTDVTNRYTFDDGQRDTVYDVSRIILKPGFDAPVGQLLIAFDYFDHTTGDFCTVDSYLHEAGVGADEIPSYNSPALGKVSLGDVLDFRPKVDNDAIISGYQDSSLLGSVNTRSFAGGGGIVSSTPAPDSNLEFTFSFSQTQYLSRIDGLFLDKKGKFYVKEGNSSLNPTRPESIEDSIALYYMYIPAFTQSSKDVRIVPVDHKRYTMRDIGKLEKRIERLEYYTTLSILEQQALNMQVIDGNGNNRFKSGFIVDNYETHKIGNLKSIDYKCSVDTQQSVMRPQSKEDSFMLEEINTRNDQRTSAGYVRNGDRVTLPFTELEMVKNEFATKTINPNPFVVLQYAGDSFIGPNVDSWYDTSVEPLVTDNNTNLYSIFIAKDNIKDAFSSLYNSYKVNWLGANRSFFNIESFADTNSDLSGSNVTSASVSSSSNVSPDNNEIGKGISTKGVGSNVVATSLSFFARSIPLKFVINRLKPNTTVYPFMEGQDISRWVNSDSKYTGIAGNSLSSFNTPIKTDANGNASGIILVPAGQPPRENSVWGGSAENLDYDTDSVEVRFTTGVKTIRFTSSKTDAPKEDVETYAEVKFYATGLLPENPASIVSTAPAFFKANEGTQTTDSNTENPIKPNPLAQTFTVDGFDGGIFATSVDLFFSTKSENIPIRVYLTDIQNGKPGKNILPGTQKVLNPDTYLRVLASDTLEVTKGEKVTGQSSNASGPISKVFDKNNIELTPTSTGVFSLSNDQVFTLVLDNHTGTSFKQDETLTIPSVTAANNANNTSLSLKIVKDSGRVTGLTVKDTGTSYNSAIITLESPQLPGGGGATATVRVSNGKVYHSDIVLSGSEYTEPPAVIIRGTGTGNSGAVIESSITIDTPAVRMGISIDQDGTTNSTVPTNFKFDYPVYLQNDTEYALVLETDSIDYKVWASKLSETDVATSKTVAAQPALGSLFKSQNTNSWTEDLFEDLKFTLHRAKFDVSRTAELLLTNEDLGYELLDVNPIETNSNSQSGATSNLFKNNRSVIKVNHFNNGFSADGESYVFFKGGLDVGGIVKSELNDTLYQVTNVGIDSYNIISVNKATSSAFGGGSSLFASYNRKFEKLHAIVPTLEFADTKIESFVKTTNIKPIDDNVGTFATYSQPDYEKTFLNEDFFFINQKVLASRVNESLNNVDRSLTYKIMISSEQDTLSPLVDLSRASLKTISNRIENAEGKESRYGRRDQVLEFFPVWSFVVTNTSGVAITENQRVSGLTTNASGTILKVDGSTLIVRVDTVNTFVQGEGLKFADSALNPDTSGANAGIPKVTVTPSQGNVTEVVPVIPNESSPQSTVFVRDASQLNENYDNKISGTVVLWNQNNKILTIINNKKPLGDDYTSASGSGQFSRVAVGVSPAQESDIIRVGDIIGWTNQTAGEENYLMVSNVSYTDGIDFVSDIQSKGTSSAASYVTKEVSITNPATGIDVRMTANTVDIENIEVLYRVKKSSSEDNFEDLEWVYFNETGLPDVDLIATAENSISGITEKQEEYQELSYSVDNLPEFSSFAVKVVMKTSNPAFVPKVQDLRAVASY
tara:strand:- start:2244 stop:10703 length:8460 start_codon:yes stop_codon:yes gene_type:complete